MKLNIEPIRNWFGFTRRERRSSFILIVIAFFILGIRFTVPEKNFDIQVVTDSIPVYTATESPGNEQNGKLRQDATAKAGISGGRSVRQVYRKRPPVNLNRCDTSQLISLPGIGPVLSVRIIKYRTLLGGFASVDQLKEVYGLSAETFDLIKGRVYADSSEVTRININDATYKELSRLPYFDKYEVTAILKYKELKGRIESINDLTVNKLIPSEKVPKIRPYLYFE